MDQQNMPAKKLNFWMISTLILIGVAVGFGVSKLPYFSKADTKTSAVTADKDKQPEPSTPRPEVKKLSADETAKLLDTNSVKGDLDAAISLVEFSDFQCPFCARFAANTISQVDENYAKSGKVKIAFRDYPLDFHKNAAPAALAARCAGEQGKFWEMHDVIFAKQSEWSGEVESALKFKLYAKQLGLDVKKFNGCFDSKKYIGEIQKDLIAGIAAGIEGTPGSFINGKEIAGHCWALNRYNGKYEWQKMSGAMPFETVFKPVIEAELAGKKWELEFSNFSCELSVKVQ
ncbi:thioredoxin domain-containing protein [Candidatus Peregrinibacteria bacterium]|nr:thioredoxin domain-containing protein [Candidatus Peregrinibacteria bacterium]